ncbi:alpha/beta fold hydrolase [Sporosarcina trichiuri]|uniref:alpha/beta fold hydrolase n=1 Tax=Sporosarcina trichiuri TaxID=3056445 RepID=UPI0025B531F9|nr:alpha/beta fold hydrolase [Sporosarcina sp. 0.2-SM1T-5]WJY28662.1 alpha/beta fold hydrolase [Sporosarcina sp. 0.2-SM1T-5]
MERETLIMSDGCMVEAVSLGPGSTPRGHIHLVHGMAEHIGRYSGVMEELAAQGYAVSGQNQRGHGPLAEEAGRLGDFGDNVTFDRLAEDVREVLAHYKKRFGRVPCILFGHSMGSFVVRRYSQKHGRELDALILSGTAGGPGIGGTILASMLSVKDGSHAPSYLLDKLGFGGYNRSVDHPETKFDWLSTDRRAVREYIADPLSGAVSTNKFFRVLFEGLKVISTADAYRSVPKSLPVLLISGSDDPVGDMGAGVFEAAALYRNAGVRSVTVSFREGERHEILQGAAQARTLAVMLEWLVKS